TATYTSRTNCGTHRTASRTDCGPSITYWPVLARDRRLDRSATRRTRSDFRLSMMVRCIGIPSTLQPGMAWPGIAPERVSPTTERRAAFGVVGTGIRHTHVQHPSAVLLAHGHHAAEGFDLLPVQ